MKKFLLVMLAILGLTFTSRLLAKSADSSKGRIVPFGTNIDPQVQIRQSQQLAKATAATASQSWKSKGDQHRNYFFKEASMDMPYRVYVPATWDGKSKLPLVMFLHGAWNDESSYVDANDGQMLKLAEEHGFILVSPLGYTKLGGYGQCLLLPGLFGKPEEIKKIMDARTPEREHTLDLSEKDVINVLELVLNEYPVDKSAMFLTGHSMGAGGTLYIGVKYNHYWRAIAPMSGPFADVALYPWNRIRKMPIFLSEGTRATASLESSRMMKEWMQKEKFSIRYKEVDGDHGGMVPLILPDVFSFFSGLYRHK